MKLPDFRLYEPLNQLKARLGLRADEFGSFAVVVAAGGLTREQLDILATEGIEVGWDDLTHISNGTFSYKGNRVLLYIRDVAQYGNQISEPRYHLATCATITKMHNEGRGQRYVVSVRTDGVFRVNINSPTGRRAEDLPLKVCRNCLGHLGLNGFRSTWGANRQQFVDDFLPEHFFAQYPQSPHKIVPSYDSDGAPPNDYTADFQVVSARMRQQAGWRCAKCLADLSAQHLRRFLQVHHIDGNRWDNSTHNLRVLCLRCHAEEPSHAHMKNSSDYREYSRLRPAR